MKKRYIALLLLLFIVVTWLASILLAGILTALYADEFSDFKALEVEWLYNAFDETANKRVITYTGKRAKVYFYSEYYGECISFVKKDGEWKFDETIANWSSRGSADDFFIWPYFKHYVP